MTGEVGGGRRSRASLCPGQRGVSSGLDGPRCPLEAPRDPAGAAHALCYGERGPGIRPVAAAPAPAPAAAGGAAGGARAAGEVPGGRAAQRAETQGGQQGRFAAPHPPCEQGWPPVGPWRAETSQLGGVASRPQEPPAGEMRQPGGAKGTRRPPRLQLGRVATPARGGGGGVGPGSPAGPRAPSGTPAASANASV